MPPITSSIPSVSVNYARTGRSTAANELGMREMQERAFERRGAQYLLIKAPPASGKSRALMFIALDKLHNQGLRKALVVVPERAIGASFNSEPLSKYGFWADWVVPERWNLCNGEGEEDNGSKVAAVEAFLADGEARVLVCTHATFRFAVDRLGVEPFDECLLAVDEFHHVSMSPQNRLGEQLRAFIARDRVHIVAMTGSYFRGDSAPVLSPEDEARFEPVTYTYYEQLNGYEYLKQLDIGYYFYTGLYTGGIGAVLDTDLKTILHIPHVGSKDSTFKGKLWEADEIRHVMGDWLAKDSETGFDLVKRRSDGRVLRVADLVDPDTQRYTKVLKALKDPAQKNNRDHVDVILALGMAKEGFDWIWCEHALTVGYRASLTEVVQIIGRATRDAPGKARARFTNLIAEPDASAVQVTSAVNDTLKAIAAGLLMEQVLTPKFNFTAKGPKPPNGPPSGAGSGGTEIIDGWDWGTGGYDSGKNNVGKNPQTGEVQIEITGLAEPKSSEAVRICQEDINELLAVVVQDRVMIENGLFNTDIMPQELTQVRLGEIIREKYPMLDEGDREAVRQRAVAALSLLQQAKAASKTDDGAGGAGEAGPRVDDGASNTALIDGVRKFALSVTELNIDLIDSINPFAEAYAVLAKALNPQRLQQIQQVITAKKIKISPQQAKELAIRAALFKKEKGRPPSADSTNPWEVRMAEGARAFVRYRKEGVYEKEKAMQL